MKVRRFIIPVLVSIMTHKELTGEVLVLLESMLTATCPQISIIV